MAEKAVKEAEDPQPLRPHKGDGTQVRRVGDVVEVEGRDQPDDPEGCRRRQGVLEQVHQVTGFSPAAKAASSDAALLRAGSPHGTRTVQGR